MRDNRILCVTAKVVDYKGYYYDLVCTFIIPYKINEQQKQAIEKNLPKAHVFTISVSHETYQDILKNKTLDDLLKYHYSLHGWSDDALKQLSPTTRQEILQCLMNYIGIGGESAR